MSLKSISPQKARELLNQGAILVDIRSADEHAREHIADARHLPLDRLQQGVLQNTKVSAVIYHCRSGNRTSLNANALAACAPCEAYVLEGGLDAWKKAGLPVQKVAGQPLELQRQVQIAAGTLIVMGALLGVFVSPWFYWLSGLIGAGLIFAGVSGFCGLARVLMMMPWNRRATNAAG